MHDKITALVAAALAGVMLAAGVTAVSAKEFKLIASSSHPPIVPWVKTIKTHVVPETNKRLAAMGSPHRVKWTEAYAGALYNFQNTLEGIQQGLGDIGWVGTLWEPVKMPLHNITYYAPFAAEDATMLLKIQEDLEANFKAMKAEWDRHNIVYLGAQVADSYQLMTKKPIRKLEDVNGIKLMAPGAIAPLTRNTGAIPVNGGLPVFYNNMKTGVADGAIIITTGMVPFKLHEVAPYITNVNFGGCICGALAINKDSWKRLPNDVRKVLQELGPEYSRIQTSIVVANEKKFRGIMVKQGATITEYPESERKRWAMALPNIAAEWADGLEKKGVPGKAMLAAFMDAVRKYGGKPVRDWDK